MARRLGKVLGRIMNMSQAAFVLGKHVQNHVLLAYELIRGYSTKGGALKCMFLMDIQKAYNSVEWQAIEDIMAELSFPNQFIERLVVKIVSYRIMQKLKRNPNFNFHSKCKKLSIVNISFVDDLLLFTRGNLGSTQLAMQKFRDFLEATCLCVNHGKCRAYFGNVEKEVKHPILHVTGFKEGPIPFRYFRITLTSKKLSVNNCLRLVEKNCMQDKALD
ncbi:uncharacterized protein LOC131594955 [Vicia villosa]|uniref:uncharacterized protein LOC131594955 n=1 Tax=Vicia villosa TaxID=3911 RepID=UPI00273CD67D|nr:uncharacterized protein LOC131594955 [Vicia villosa]